MLVSDLMTQLAKYPVDMPIHVWADHGQQSLAAECITASFVDNDGEEVDGEEYDECPEEYTAVLEIAAP